MIYYALIHTQSEIQMKESWKVSYMSPKAGLIWVTYHNTNAIQARALAEATFGKENIRGVLLAK